MNPGEIRILVVDDHEASLYLKSHILRKAGFTVMEAGTGRDAFILIEANPPELVVLDVQLPDMNGLEICRELKSRATPVLVLQTSATFVRSPDRALGLDSGADAYLFEPVEAEELIATVNALLRIRRAEGELRRVNENLEQRVEERTEELAQANRQLLAEVEDRRKAEEALRQAQKMEAVGQLTGGIAHDFNNLLTVIFGGLETVQRRLPKDDERLRLAVEHSLTAARRAAALTHRLLAFARRQPLEPKHTDVNQLVRNMLEIMARTLGESIALNTVLAGDVWATEVDQNQLENALLNLAVNARDAMPEGGNLYIETVNTYLEEDFAHDSVEVKPGEYVMISVSDTGEGMADETLSKAFEPFFTTKAIGQGTGLGLSQVYGFVKQSGGHVKIYSRLQAGTTVRIYLPRHIGAVAENPHMGEGAKAAPRIPRAPKDVYVLVVEDDPGVRAYSSDALRELGYQVLHAGDGVTALKLLRENPQISLLFTDVGLPGGMNGRQLADAAMRVAPALKVLFTTGYDRAAIVHDGRLEQGIHLIRKPFTYADLAARLHGLIQG